MNDTLHCTMALVCVSKPRCHVQYAVFAWGKRGEALYYRGRGYVQFSVHSYQLMAEGSS